MNGLRTCVLFSLLGTLSPAVAGQDREEVDRNDNVERVLILAPGGPLVVRMAITIDGQPFRIQREEYIDRTLARADPDGDGKVSWSAALADPHFFSNQFFYARRSPDDMRKCLKAVDLNGNGRIERAELRRAMAQKINGAFDVNDSRSHRLRDDAPPDILPVLDANGDGTLDRQELAGLEQRLNRRDVDGNEVLELSELGVRSVPMHRRDHSATFAVPLGPTADFHEVWKALVMRYARPQRRLVAGCFSHDHGLFARLDEDGDGKLVEAELKSLNRLSPHLVLSVRVGQTASRVAVTSVDRRIGEKPKPSADGSVSLMLGNLRLKFAAVNTVAPPRNDEATARQAMALVDADKNGYLEPREFAAVDAPQWEGLFEVWDANDDGKVYVEEIVAASRRDNGEGTHVTMVSFPAGNPVFDALDVSGDRRLSRREMKQAALRLGTFDRDGDGQIAPGEIAPVFQCAFWQGWHTEFGRRPARLPPRGPDWFIRMDRNGDGDVTPKEFLGDEQQFQRLDLDQDGFLAPEETEQGQAPAQAEE